MFAVMGMSGLAMAAVWFALYRNPTEVALTPEETHYRTQGDPPGERTCLTWGEWSSRSGSAPPGT